MNNRFYVTTPIYYVNDKPHIGHLCTTLAADVLARFYRREYGKNNVFFITGVDEHGAKITEAAKKENKSPKKYCDGLAKDFQKNWDRLNLSYDYFFRTTDSRHKKIVSKILKKLYKHNLIYKGTYKGLYCIGCEKFLTEQDLVNGKCPLHPNREPVYQNEKNYFFRLNKYEKQIKTALKNGDYKIFPPNKKHEILSKLELRLNDISISRAEVPWGIPIPWDKKQTIYVWVEALFNYYTATQFLKGKSQFWPADLHIVGKEISWFHNVIWEALLMAAKLPLPKKIFVHSFYISGGKKMSKSLGNVISPDDLINKFGLDGTRYLILSTFPYSKDSDITLEFLVEKYNSDLANGLGNLVQRTARLCEKKNYLKLHSVIKKLSLEKSSLLYSRLNNLEFNYVLEKIWKLVKKADTLIDREKVWNLPDKKAQKVLNQVINYILGIAVDLEPFLPETAEKIEKIFTAQEIKAPSKPLFPRI